MRRLIAYLWQIEFAWRLSRHTGVRVTRRMLNAAPSRLPEGAMPGTDGARRFNLTLARSLHGAVTLLEREAGLPPQRASHAAEAAFVASGSWLARASIRLWLRLERDPFAGVQKRGPSLLAKAMWGDGMMVEDRRVPGAVSLCVLSCPLHDYFWNVGRSDLTPILCAWDTAWQAEVNASARPIRVDIRSTLAEGDAMCEFVFRKPAGAER